MKCPKYIEDAIYARARAAEKLAKTDLTISQWLEKNNVECEFTHLHVETISNPYFVLKETLKDISAHKNANN